MAEPLSEVAEPWDQVGPGGTTLGGGAGPPNQEILLGLDP